MKVQNFHHLNQFVLHDWKKTYFQSYDSMICKVDDSLHTIEFWRDWDYSKTTSKHLYMFLDEYTDLWILNKKQIQKMIDEWKTANWINRYWTIEYTVLYNEYL